LLLGKAMSQKKIILSKNKMEVHRENFSKYIFLFDINKFSDFQQFLKSTLKSNVFNYINIQINLTIKNSKKLKNFFNNLPLF
jgi:hypothetical protein